MRLAAFFLIFSLLSMPFAASMAKETAFRSTSYPLPRFVSLNSDEVYVRAGPGTRYPVKWIYKKKGLPLEVVLEFESWRKIEDYEGHSGWIHQSLLSGKRTGLVHYGENADLYKRPKEDARKIARIEPNVIGAINECRKEWCAFEAGGYKGWMQRKYIWGIYESELFD